MTSKENPAGHGGLAGSNIDDLACDYTSPAVSQYTDAMAGEIFGPLVADLAIVHIAADAVARGVALAAEDRPRVALAVSRVRAAMSAFDGGRRHG